MSGELNCGADADTRVCEVCRCDSITPVPAYTTSQWPVVACAQCGFVFLHNVPGYSALVEDYAWEKTHSAESVRRLSERFGWLDKATRWRLRLGKRLNDSGQYKALGRTGRILDVGCGPSCRLPQGVTPYGIEISEGLFKAAEPDFAARGGRVVHAPAHVGMNQFPDSFFNSILMRSYLEHEENPRLVLELAFAKLVPGGTIYVRVPDYGSINRRVRGAQWCGFRFPDHVNYFTNHSLSSLAENIGFTYKRKNAWSLFDDNIIAGLKRPMPHPAT